MPCVVQTASHNSALLRDAYSTHIPSPSPSARQLAHDAIGVRVVARFVPHRQRVPEQGRTGFGEDLHIGVGGQVAAFDRRADEATKMSAALGDEDALELLAQLRIAELL